MNDLLWIAATATVGVVIAVVILPWRFKWRAENIATWFGLWALFWPFLLVYLAVFEGFKTYINVWYRYLDECEHRKHQPEIDSAFPFPKGHDTVRRTFFRK